ncbi:MAG: HNH endonuclease [Candidatus Eisenbacteria bacterium]|nr:HNH endonuclease [Candidatus Eisenbacteria bacterium]
MLEQPTLVLNRHWVPIGTVSVRSALCLLYREAARAILPQDYSLHDFDSWASLRPEDNEPAISTVKLRIKVPEVLLLTQYGAFPRRRVTFSRKNLYRRDLYTCQYCGAKPALHDLSVDHVVPRSRGGTSTWENCVLACLRCNRKKANRTLRESGLRLTRAPREPRWSPFVTIPVAQRRTSWEQFISNEYWNVELSE